ncbi:TetR/AcrR family transcriptional regulator [Rhodococcus sp. 06-156-3C]|uniref:TetR/AcrR family transcriptional regulator n=1 Tax=Nocardiaceae TaxID=85025 RepID=UPI000522FCE0|nr:MULTISPECIES: TetR/AcrR family transcriptional regulator [Rhodococcus]OZD07632.1 TetR/AcrR family transcriptional regulator [Rhodococcus sp. 06-156-4C]OZD17157.1 TetR/AcrR family transcriptional regulator [Rhodococcus sp. 06-156-3C]OZD18495.1 TetR/AcrR family transcriptional regulator [Rhodococcus sp. 06-156-4a]OZD28304.1 TetR/AcrR family transcriptional regulator [Rhodococcus sp. 06-156-3]OZD29927.1 TetR/AcrR family transcriptional regulator [Rhodococcus sp. 06-156-3b]
MNDTGSWRRYEASTLPAPLAAALSAFVDQGYHGTSVREIAGRAGLSVPGLYHHYPSKQALLVGLMTAAMDELLERSRSAETEAGPSPRKRFDAVVESLLLFHMHRREQAFLGSTEIRSLDEVNRIDYVGRRDEQQRMVDAIVADGIASGDFGLDHAEDASRAVTTMCIGVAGWYRPDGPLAPSELVETYLAIARRIVEARVEPAE